MNDIRFVKAANCTKSPANVRKSSDPGADAQLAANIAANGILQNLVALPVARKKHHYRIVAGGRRLDGVHANIAAGIFPDTYEIPVKVLADARDAVEISLSENFFSLEMNPADACRAFQDILETEGKTPSDIASRFGLTERFVRGRLRLANLAEPVFTALAEGQITLDVAIAYASIADATRQASVFAELSDSYYAGNVNEIRRRLAAGACRGGDPKALLVGRDDYLAAGGRIDGDLFSASETELWIDGDILERLANDKLEAAAAALRDREGFAEVRAIATGHVPYAETCHLRRLHGEPVPLSPEAVLRKVEIEAELAAIEGEAEAAEDYTGEQSQRIEALEEELGTLVDTGEAISDDQRATAIAWLVLGQDGQPTVYEQLYTVPEADPDEDQCREADDSGDGPAHEAEAPDVDGRMKYSVRLSDKLAMMKTELLALHVARNPDFARDLGTFILVDHATSGFHYGMPSELRAPAPTPRVSGFESGTLAADAWSGLDGALDRSWTGHKQVEQRYDAFCALEPVSRAAWLAWVVARTLQSVPEGASGSGFLNHLGRKLDIDVAREWRPAAANFFDWITRPAILSLFEAMGGSELRSRYAAARKHDLAATAEKLFAGQLIVEAEVREAVLDWLPDPMRFDDPAIGEADLGEGSQEPEHSDDDANADVAPATGTDGRSEVILQAA